MRFYLREIPLPDTLSAGECDKPETKLEDAAGKRNSTAKTVPVTTHKPGLEQVKERFLGSSDWLGLSAARPVLVRFKNVEDMSKLGRHRKSSSKGRVACNAQQDAYEKRFASPVLGKRKRKSDARDSDIASKTPKQELQVESTKPSSYLPSSPPVLARYRLTSEPTTSCTSLSLPSLPATNLDRTFYRLDSDEPELQQADTPLLSLDAVRDLSSFDEIRARLTTLVSTKDESYKSSNVRGTMLQQIPSDLLTSRDDVPRCPSTSTSIKRQLPLPRPSNVPSLFAIEDENDVSLLDELINNDFMTAQQRGEIPKMERFHRQSLNTGNTPSSIAALPQAPSSPMPPRNGAADIASNSSFGQPSLSDTRLAATYGNHQEEHNVHLFPRVAPNTKSDGDRTVSGWNYRRRHKKYSLHANLDPQAIQFSSQDSRNPMEDSQQPLRILESDSFRRHESCNGPSPSLADDTYRDPYNVEDFLTRDQSHSKAFAPRREIELSSTWTKRELRELPFFTSSLQQRPRVLPVLMEQESH